MLKRWKVCSGLLILALGMVGLCERVVTATSEGLVRTVRGVVIATNVKDTPQIVVVRVLMPNKEELTVGASVPMDTRITRAKRPIPLADIKVGDSVDLTYGKNPSGLVAQMIQVR